MITYGNRGSISGSIHSGDIADVAITSPQFIEVQIKDHTIVEFGHLCGRQNSWFSSAKSVGRSMSIGSMISLVTNLERIPSTDIPRAMRPHVKSFIAMLWQMIENKAAGPAHN
jgi:hypothetical protein